MQEILGFWDIALLITVPAIGTLVAYLRSPRHKALVLCFPVPFTFATLALGEGVNSTHVLGLLMLLGFWFVVYWLRHRARLPIVLAIALGAMVYCITGVLLAKVVPKTEVSFWVALVSVCLIALTLNAKLSFRTEPEHSSKMPVWVKLPLLLCVVLCLISVKSLLAGFMTMFPMVGVLTAYESRYSLWTICRKIPVLMISMAFMMAAIHLASPEIGIYYALGLGWIIMSLVLAVLLRHHWAREREHVRTNPLLATDNSRA